MLKKLFVTAAAAAAVSVPLAGVAWADPPSDPGSNGNGIGKGGIPNKTGNVLDTVTPQDFQPPGYQTGDPVTPGSVFSQVAKFPKEVRPPGVSVPDAYGQFLTGFWQTHALPPGQPDLTGVEFGKTPPGSVVRGFTPGCAQHSSGVCLETP